MKAQTLLTAIIADTADLAAFLERAKAHLTEGDGDGRTVDASEVLVSGNGQDLRLVLSREALSDGSLVYNVNATLV